MKRFLLCFFALAATCGDAQAADNAGVKKELKGKVEEINNALIKGEYAKVVDLTHPALVKLLGGREKMISILESGMKEMKSQGIALRSTKVDEPSEPVAGGADLFAVVPFLLEIKAPGGKLLQKGYVIGVSSDQGKSWVFVGGDVDTKQLKQVLPNLPDQLKLPAAEKPVFEKE